MSGFIDLTGERFGNLVVLERSKDLAYPNGQKVIIWKCQCDCGKTVFVRGSDLRSGATKSCGCLKHKQSLNLEDLSGQRFGRLTVINRAENSKSGRVRWLCKCDCGKETVVFASALKGGLTISCGCLNDERRIQSHTKHGKCKTRLYRIWKNMKHRCFSEDDKRFDCYGARGITICDEWENDFNSFYQWAVKNGYSDDLQIDRIDVNGDYEPSNCRWVDAFIQANNKRNNTRISYGGETHTLPEWSRMTGLKQGTIRERIKLGWDINDLFKPVRV